MLGDFLSRGERMSAAPMKRWLFWALLAHSFAVLCWRWNQPLVGEHGFRQTQTAISVFWMLRGSPLIAYWTPVLGPPWQIPFEFPLYQWVLAVFAWAGMGIDNAGRLASWSFGVAVLCPLFKISRVLSVDAWIAAALYLASPLYLFWGTAFLIDTTALFFAAMFLMYALENRWALSLICGVLAALIKLPTVIPFAALALLWSCWPLVSRGASGQMPSRLARLSGRS